MNSKRKKVAIHLRNKVFFLNFGWWVRSGWTRSSRPKNGLSRVGPTGLQTGAGRVGPQLRVKIGSGSRWVGRVNLVVLLLMLGSRWHTRVSSNTLHSIKRTLLKPVLPYNENPVFTFLPCYHCRDCLFITGNYVIVAGILFPLEVHSYLFLVPPSTGLQSVLLFRYIMNLLMSFIKQAT